MHVAALVIALLASAAIVAIGTRFLLAPRIAMDGYGVAADAPGAASALTEVKGVRDIASGVVMLVVLAAAGTASLGWALVAVAVVPVGDALIVRRNGGTLAHALTVHGLTAVLLVAAGLVLALG